VAILSALEAAEVTDGLLAVMECAGGARDRPGSHGVERLAVVVSAAKNLSRCS
jgi:hypothetical protein